MKIGKAFPSQYLKAADLEEDIIVTIAGCKMETIAEDKKPVIYFKELDKGMVLNKTNAEAISKVLGSDDTDDWIGGRIGLTVMSVPFQGGMVDAIRVKMRKPQTAAAGAQHTQRKSQTTAAPPEAPPAEYYEPDEIPI